MSLPSVHRRERRPISEPDRAGIASVAASDEVSQEQCRQLRLRREQQVDEELAHSFPASDPPSWVHGT